MTDKSVTKAFMKDIRSVGYAHMRVYNYRKSGEVFEVDVTVYPVFDSICAVGQDAEVAVLTHFASVMTNVKDFVPANSRHNITVNDGNQSMDMVQSSSNCTDNVSSYNDGHKSSSTSNNITTAEEGERLMSSGGMMQRMFGVSTMPPATAPDNAWTTSSSNSFTPGGKDSGATNNESSSEKQPASSDNNPSSNNGTDSDPISTVSDSNPSPTDSTNQGSDSNPPSGSSENGYSDTSSRLGSDSAGLKSSNNADFVDRRNLEMRFIAKCGILSEVSCIFCWLSSFVF